MNRVKQIVMACIFICSGVQLQGMNRNDANFPNNWEDCLQSLIANYSFTIGSWINDGNVYKQLTVQDCKEAIVREFNSNESLQEKFNSQFQKDCANWERSARIITKKVYCDNDKELQDLLIDITKSIIRKTSKGISFPNTWEECLQSLLEKNRDAIDALIEEFMRKPLRLTIETNAIGTIISEKFKTNESLQDDFNNQFKEACKRWENSEKTKKEFCNNDTELDNFFFTQINRIIRELIAQHKQSTTQSTVDSSSHEQPAQQQSCFTAFVSALVQRFCPSHRNDNGPVPQPSLQNDGKKAPKITDEIDQQVAKTIVLYSQRGKKTYSSFAENIKDELTLTTIEKKINETAKPLLQKQVPYNYYCFWQKLNENEYAIQLPARTQWIQTKKTLDLKYDCGFRAFIASLFFAKCTNLTVLVKCLVSPEFEACVASLKKLIIKELSSERLDCTELNKLLGIDDMAIISEAERSEPNRNQKFIFGQTKWPTQANGRTIIIKLLGNSSNLHYIVECTDTSEKQFKIVFIHDSLATNLEQNTVTNKLTGLAPYIGSKNN